MTMHRIPAVFMRGGTSKALIFRASDLPESRDERDAIFRAAMGVPDPYARQLDGMGGGVSSLNKVCIVGPPSRADADVDYTFVQLSADRPEVDYGGNCGNMSSAIGPFALEEGLIEPIAGAEAAVRIHNTNTGKIIVSRFPLVDGLLAPDGDFALDGVAGTAAPVRLEFLDPGGAKTGKLLPTGSPVDRIEVTGLGTIGVSCVDAANPAVFVRAADLGLTGTELPEALERDAAFMARMEEIRCKGAVLMGLTADLDAAGALASIPKVAMVAPPRESPLISGETLPEDAADILIRMISVGQPHRAVPITGAIGLAIAARLEGSIPHEACIAHEGPIRVGHASGTTVVDAQTDRSADGTVTARLGAVYRSARRLFEGRVVYRLP